MNQPYSRRARLPVAQMPQGPVGTWQSFIRAANHGDPRLCHTLAEKCDAGSEDREGAGRVDRGKVPWVIPVLGSGCSSEPDRQQLEVLKGKPATIHGALAQVHLPGGTDPAVMAFDFSCSLLKRRIQQLSDEDFPQVGVPATPADELAARCVLAAALVHRAWHECAAQANELLRARDTLRIPSDELGDEVVVGLLRPAQEQLALAAQALNGLPGDDAVRAVENMVLNNLTLLNRQLADGQPNLTGNDVDGLIEAAWLVMITPHGLYPGWHDTILQTALDDDVPLDFARPRPVLQGVDQADSLAAKVASLNSATNKSWEERQASQTTPRNQFYDAVADLLIAQHEFGNRNSPLPMAYVASMDVELEMSLIAKKQQFTVLVPHYLTYVTPQREQRAMFFWLAATIEPQNGSWNSNEPFLGDPDKSLAGLKPIWRVPDRGLSKPTDTIAIVRLIGSPLLPQVADNDKCYAFGIDGLAPSGTILERLEELAGLGPNTQKQIVRAFMFDEYSGMNQMVAVVQGNQPMTDPGADIPSIYRFWVAVGVPLDDFLIRLLVASHIDRASGLRGLLDDGVMVNRTVARAEFDLLAWQGLSAVQSDFTQVTKDIEHYSQHMRSEPWPVSEDTTTFRTLGKCRVR